MRLPAQCRTATKRLPTSCEGDCRPSASPLWERLVVATGVRRGLRTAGRDCKSLPRFGMTICGMVCGTGTGLVKSQCPVCPGERGRGGDTTKSYEVLRESFRLPLSPALSPQWGEGESPRKKRGRRYYQDCVAALWSPSTVILLLSALLLVALAHLFHALPHGVV